MMCMDRASFAAACATPARSPGPATRQDTIWVAGPGERAGVAFCRKAEKENQ
jgi:hypothetical protein